MRRFDLYEYSINDIITIMKKLPFHSEIDDSKNIYSTYQDDNSKECEKIRNDWEIPNNLHQCTSFENLINIMKWYKNAFNFSRNSANNGIEKLMENSNYEILYEKIKNGEIAFTDYFETLFFLYVLLSLGYKARFVKCMTTGFSQRCIFLIEIYINEYEKWVVADIRNNDIYLNEKGIPLNLVEIRISVTNEYPISVLNNSGQLNKNIFNSLIPHLFKFEFLLDNKIDIFCSTKIKFAILSPKILCGTDKIKNNDIECKKYEYIFTSNPLIFYNNR